MNYYETLGVDINASAVEIKAAYRREAMKWHPDRHHGSQEKIDATIKFKAIAEAYRTLIDPDLRAEYDASEPSKTGGRFNEDPKTNSNPKEADADNIFNEQIIDLACELANQGFSSERIFNTLTLLGCPNALAKAAASLALRKCNTTQNNNSHNQSNDETYTNPNNEFYRALIGEKRQDYYLNHFLEFDNKSPSIQLSWNWWAALFNVFWMFYRKMWLEGAFYFASYYIAIFAIAGSISATTKSFEESFHLASGIVLVPFFVLTGLFANWYYYRHCKRRITKINKKETKHSEKIIYLTQKGGTSNIIYYALISLFFISAVGIIAAITLPAYQDYSKRAINSNAHQKQSIPNGGQHHA